MKTLDDNGSPHREWVKDLQNGDKSKRRAIWELARAPRYWSDYGSEYSNKALSQYLDRQGISIQQSEISRYLNVSKIEQALGMDVGVIKEAVLRSMIPLLKRGLSPHLDEVWRRANELSGGKRVKAKHVKAAMDQLGILKTRIKKATSKLAIANSSENRKEVRRSLEIATKNMHAEDLSVLLKTARRLDEKRTKNTDLNKQ